MLIKIPVSVGELLDKITILLIKEKNTQNKNIQYELNELMVVANSENVYNNKFIKELYYINETLWNIEERLREIEKTKNFTDEFITLARNVYKYNDERAKIKQEINKFYQSDIVEVKSYETSS